MVEIEYCFDSNSLSRSVEKL